MDDNNMMPEGEEMEKKEEMPAEGGDGSTAETPAAPAEEETAM